MVEVLFTQVKTPGPRSAKGPRCLQEPKKQRKQDSWGPGGEPGKGLKPHSLGTQLGKGSTGLFIH